MVHRACSADVSFFDANDRQKLQRPTTYLNVHDFGAVFFDWGVSVEAAAYRALAWYVKLTGLLASLYGLWIIYAAGLDYLLLSVLLYVPGIGLFLYSRYQHHGGKFNLKPAKKC